MTRFDIGFTSQRLSSEFNACPKNPAWEKGLSRIVRYLSGDVLRPLFYHCVPLEGSSVICCAQLTHS